MKIIDLLNKKAKGEKIPKTFKYKNHIIDLCSDGKYRDDEGDYLTDYIWYDLSNLNDKIEIIEDKKIEKLGLTYLKDDDRNEIIDKINEIIKRLNEVDK